MATVTQETLESSLDSVRSGSGVLWIRTYTHTTKIDRKCLVRWASVPGKPLLSASSDGKGFRLRRGNGNVYVMPGYLTLTKEG